MVSWLLLSLIPLPAIAAVDKAFGVHPSLRSEYVPLKEGTWKCLDGSQEIPWEAVNNDYCDCADGSDEPGTSACPNSSFFCVNEGHIGMGIPSSRVNDGLCEPECCDGSDERPGVCPNLCKEIGEAYRKKQDKLRKIQKTGAKIRSSYIAFAQKEKKRLEGLIASSEQEISVREKEVRRLRDIADRTESLSAAALAYKQQSPLYQSLITHSNALKSLQREHKKHLEREKALGDILSALRSGYNPNYQDMAVLEAVRGWEYHAGLPHIGVEADKLEEGSDTEEGSNEVKEEKGEPAAIEGGEEEALDESEWSAEKLENELDSLVNSDYVSLLLEHEEHVRSPHDDSTIFELSSYLPDSLLPQYEEFKDAILSWLQALGIVRGAVDTAAADTSRARQALADAENGLQRITDQKKDAENDLAELFNIHGFGAEGEWKKLDGTCLELDTGEYTYEVCLFDEARQKPNKGGSTFSLGKFKSWNPSPDVKPGDPAYYTKQVYKNGARCWNGPERNVILVMTCGTENAIHTVAELEKCEYQFTGTSPALCLPVDSAPASESATKKREEL